MLLRIPQLNDLTRLYFELGKLGAPLVGEKKSWPYKPTTDEELIILACEISRYDPRLFEGLVLFFGSKWQTLNPTVLRMHYPHIKSPQTIAVICEFLTTETINKELNFFIQYLQAGLTPLPYQYYFHHLYQPGSKLSTLPVDHCVAQFLKWGFLSEMRPITNTQTRETSGQYNKEQRLNILSDTLNKDSKITISKYLEQVHHSISRQQALLDLKSFPHLKQKGHGRGSVWIQN